MRQLSELIEEVRFNTNQTRNSRYTDAILINYFNSAQRHIQKIIFNANPSNNVFDKETTITLVSGQNEYTLPDDMLAVSSITDIVPVNFNGSFAKPLRALSEKEKHSDYGYYVIKNKLKLTPVQLLSSFKELCMTYTPVLTRMTSVSDFPELPETCEEYLMAYVERKIERVSSAATDFATADVFTKEEREQIASLFANHSKDVKYPVVSDATYFNY